MKCKMLKSFLTCSLFILLSVGSIANAGVINSTSGLLNDSRASELEAWLGQSDLDWQSVWYGTTGAKASSWHKAVDGAGPTVSIYDVTWNGANYLIGGYTDLNWGAPNGYKYYEGNSFTFNLTTHAKYGFTGLHSGTTAEILADTTHFATFGNGYDLYGGSYTLGAVSGSTWDLQYAQHSAAQLSSMGWGRTQLFGSSKNLPWQFVVNKLETFTFSTPVPPPVAQPVSEPTTFAMFVLAISGLVTRRFINKK